MGEAIAALLRWCTESFELVQRLVRFVTTAVHMNGNQLYAMLLDLLLRELRMVPESLTAFSRDSCATNGVAVRQLRLVCTRAMDVLCTPHIIHGMGTKISFEEIPGFMTYWYKMLKSSGARKIWLLLTGADTMPRFSKIRWWSRWDCFRQIRLYFPDVLPFVLQLQERGLCEASAIGMRTVLDDPAR